MPTWSDATGIERSGYGSVPPLARVRYRVRQFVRGVSAQVSDQDRAAAVALLPADAAAHFLRLPIDAQHHSLNVLFALRQRGFDDPDLAAAALLHDVGKLATEEAGIRTNVWLRGPLVLLDAVGSRLGPTDGRRRSCVGLAVRIVRSSRTPGHRRGMGCGRGLYRVDLLAHCAPSRP